MIRIIKVETNADKFTKIEQAAFKEEIKDCKLYNYGYIVYSDNNANDLAAIARMDARYGDKWREKNVKTTRLKPGHAHVRPMGGNAKGE